MLYFIDEWLAKRRKGAAVLKEKSDRFHSLKSGEVAQLKTDIKVEFNGTLLYKCNQKHFNLLYCI